MKHLLPLPKFVKLLFLGSLFAVALPLLNSCAENNNNAASADSTSTMSTTDTSAATMAAPMTDSDTAMMRTDTSGGKDGVRAKDKKP